MFLDSCQVLGKFLANVLVPLKMFSQVKIIDEASPYNMYKMTNSTSAEHVKGKQS